MKLKETARRIWRWEQEALRGPAPDVETALA